MFALAKATPLKQPPDPLLDFKGWSSANQHHQRQQFFGIHIAMLPVLVCQDPLASVKRRLPAVTHAVLWCAGCPMLCCAEHSAYSMA